MSTMGGMGTFGGLPYKQQDVFIVTYKLAYMSVFYSKLFNELKQSPNWWHYMDNTWLVIRHENLKEFSDKLRKFIYPEDRLLVMYAKGPADGWMSEEAWNWIRAHVPH